MPIVLCFFIFFLFQEAAIANSAKLIDLALEKQLHQSQTWKTLLHARDSKSFITDPNFILSSAEFSYENELKESIRLLFPPDRVNRSICRFPARYLWLSQQLEQIPNKLEECDEYSEFIAQVPVQQIKLVFASENLVSPSSMMGHILVSLSGHTIQDTGHLITRKRAHAVSFFTDIADFNIPKIIFESLVTGKDGFISLTPYRETKQYYLKNEQRSVWEYEIDASMFRKELLRAHIWELKQTKLNYFFDTYNCATFAAYLSGLLDPDFLEDMASSLSPVDIIKRAEETNIVLQREVTPSSQWRLHMLEKSLDKETKEQILKAIKTQNMTSAITANASNIDQFLALSFADSLSDYQFESATLAQQPFIEIKKQIAALRKKDKSEFKLDVSNYKSPVKTPPDSQIYSTFISSKDDTSNKHLSNNEILTLGYLPAAKSLYDDSSQFISETELRIFDSELQYNFTTERLDLKRFTLYSMSKLRPWNQYVGGLSGKFHLGVTQHYDQTLTERSAFDLSGAIGISYDVHNDIKVYGLAGGGFGHAHGKSYLYAKPELGLVIKEVFNMKTFLNYSYLYNQTVRKHDYQCVDLKQSLFTNNKYGLFLGYQKLINGEYSRDKLEFTTKLYF